MTREQANEILDAVRIGSDFSKETITAALIATGDINPAEYMAYTNVQR